MLHVPTILSILNHGTIFKKTGGPYLTPGASKDESKQLQSTSWAHFETIYSTLASHGEL